MVHLDDVLGAMYDALSDCWPAPGDSFDMPAGVLSVALVQEVDEECYLYRVVHSSGVVFVEAHYFDGLRVVHPYAVSKVRWERSSDALSRRVEELCEHLSAGVSFVLPEAVQEIYGSTDFELRKFSSSIEILFVDGVPTGKHYIRGVTNPKKMDRRLPVLSWHLGWD